MDFRDCEYFKKSEGNCPLACVCPEECYFTLKLEVDKLREYKCMYEQLCDED